MKDDDVKFLETVTTGQTDQLSDYQVVNRLIDILKSIHQEKQYLENIVRLQKDELNRLKNEDGKHKIHLKPKKGRDINKK